MSAEEKKEATSMDILESPDSPVPLIPITISYYGQEFDIELEPNSTVRELKEKLDSLAEVSVENQRLLYKQILPDDMKICEINITGRRRRIMLTGPQKECVKVRKELVELAQKLGKPSDVTSVLNHSLYFSQDMSITGLLDGNGRKVRMSIKPDALYLYTSSTTERYRRICMSRVFVEPIDDSGDYYGLRFCYDGKKLFYILWIPSHFKESIKMKLDEPNPF